MIHPRINSRATRISQILGCALIVLGCSSVEGGFHYMPMPDDEPASTRGEIASAGGEESSNLPTPLFAGAGSPQNDCHPLPPVVDDIYGHRSALLPRGTRWPYESPLFGGPLMGYPSVTRPVIGPPLLNPPPARTESPLFVPPPSAVPYMRGPTRYGLTAPIPPAVVSAHAPPWEQASTLRVGNQCHDPRSAPATYRNNNFSPDPHLGNFCWDPNGELAIYGNKHLNDVQRPAIEWGLPFYDKGPLPRSGTGLGYTNLTMKKFYVYGDYRSAVAFNQNVANEQTIWANRLNLDFDFWITSTERVHMFIGPMDERLEFNSLIYDDGRIFTNDSWDAWDPRTDTLFFEGDLGYLLGGWYNQEAVFNLPFAVGLIPLVFQNGIWIEDAFVGIAATVPARNNPLLDWSNFDTTFFCGFDEVTSNIAFEGDNRVANIVGFTTFIESRGGYIELGYAFLDDAEDQGRSYHNIGASYTRRYLNLLSNSVRMIVNTGQDGPDEERTADGLLLLLENSLLTRNPYNFIPYVNVFAGLGRPQSAARLQGPLKNTGINFESDLLTGYPTLDDSANNTFGAAIGVDLLGYAFEQQLILEAAVLQTMDDPANRLAPGDQYALGARFQKPLSHTLILRADAMYGFLENSEDITGARIELRRKF